MIRTIVLVPGEVTHGTKIPVPAALLEGKRITRVLHALRVTVDFSGTTLTTADVTSEASVHSDGDGIVLGTTDLTATDILVLVLEIDYEPGITA